MLIKLKHLFKLLGNLINTIINSFVILTLLYKFYKSKEKDAYNHAHKLHSGWNHDEEHISEFNCTRYKHKNDFTCSQFYDDKIRNMLRIFSEVIEIGSIVRRFEMFNLGNCFKVNDN